MRSAPTPRGVDGEPAAWAVEQVTGSAADLHQRPWPGPVLRTVWIQHVERPALALGSTQGFDAVDGSVAADMGVEVVRRRSGGGAVLLSPGDSTWVDILIPADDPLWEPDVGRAFHWLGHAWRRAIREASDGDIDATVHRGAPVRTACSDLICFAGLGPGEVTVDGQKLVGLSQRRTRAGARFQCIVHHRFDAARVLALLGVEPDDGAPAETLRSAVAVWVRDPHRLVSSLLHALPG